MDDTWNLGRGVRCYETIARAPNGNYTKKGRAQTLLPDCHCSHVVWYWGHVYSQVYHRSQLVILAQLTAALAFKVVQHSSCTMSDTHAMNELLLYSSLPMVLVMSGSHVLVNFIVVTWYLLLKEDLMEHNVGCVL